MSDYSRSLILREATASNVYSFFTLSEDFEGNLKLTNGKDKVYKVVKSNGGFKAVTGTGAEETLSFVYDSNHTTAPYN